MKILTLDLGHEMFANCYLLVDEKTGEAAIVDPAWYVDEFNDILEKSNAKLKYIMLTHGHFDHIFGVHGLREATGAKVVIHFKDAEHLTDPKKSLAEGNMPEPQIPVSADVLLKEGDVITLGDEEIKVMSTPGHTMGSVCYIIESEKTIISGDTLFCMTAGRTDFPDGSDELMIKSLKRLIALEGDYRVLPGHNRETTLESERKRNWYIRRMVK
ncbi:MAG: MBL fold metallo-hydrolase [Acutalibacteraceae bacterium]|nr:MBL fold metallo-hydrolase [Acutalibacteraceae bacterium]